MLETSARSLPSPGMEILRRRGTTSDVTIYESNGKLIGCKSVAERSWPFRRIVGRRLIRREMEIYRVLKGVTGIPVLIGPTGEDGFLFEYRPGTIFSRYTSESRMPDVFLAGLEDTVREMHARGLAHGALFNRGNILVGPDFTATIFAAGQEHVAPTSRAASSNQRRRPRPYAPGLRMRKSGCFGMSRAYR